MGSEQRDGGKVNMSANESSLITRENSAICFVETTCSRVVMKPTVLAVKRLGPWEDAFTVCNHKRPRRIGAHVVALNGRLTCLSRVIEPKTSARKVTD